MLIRARHLVLATLVLINVVVVRSAAAQDVITVGSVTAYGPTADVPVYIRDVAGTPLGMDQQPASRIQAFSIRVTYAPASAVSSVTFSRAGITAALNPAFETAPAGNGAIALLASFQQSSNPIPFALNGVPPGSLVAHLVFTLSSSAVVGTSISLTLDGATTQLTDFGGSAATKESDANGLLALVNGSIQIPVPSLTLAPPTLSVEAGSNASLTAETSNALISSATLTVTSSNPAVAGVAPSAVIAAGARAAAIVVSGLSAGSATITATLPASAGGGSATATVTVIAAPQCNVPVAPQISAPATALAGSTYKVTWPAVDGATEYSIDEATDAGFGSATARTVTVTNATYSHAAASDTRYFYRVRARNRVGSCDVSSTFSTSTSVLITTVVVPAMRVLPVVGSTAGLSGSFFKTSLQMYNPKAVAISGRIVFHAQGIPGAASDPSLAYSILPGKTLSFDDLLPSMGIAGGMGSADLTADATSPVPVALMHVFNDAGPLGTTGFAIEAATTDDALTQGSSGVLLMPADTNKFRVNIGVRTLDQGVSMIVTIRDRDGATARTMTKTQGPTYFRQSSSLEFLEGFTLAGGETISLTVTIGSAFVYAATTDNVTNDPSIQLAHRID